MSQAAIVSGLAPRLETKDVFMGPLGPVEGEHDRPTSVAVGGEKLEAGQTAPIDPVRTSLKPGEDVTVAAYQLPPGTTHYHIRPANEPQRPVYDQRNLPSLLFLSVAVMTLLTFFALRSQLPDLTLRTLLWFRRQRRHGLEVAGADHLPTSGPVILATNAADINECLSVLSATDRTTRFLLVRGAADAPLSGLDAAAGAAGYPGGRGAGGGGGLGRRDCARRTRRWTARRWSACLWTGRTRRGGWNGCSRIPVRRRRWCFRFGWTING